MGNSQSFDIENLYLEQQSDESKLYGGDEFHYKQWIFHCKLFSSADVCFNWMFFLPTTKQLFVVF